MAGVPFCDVIDDNKNSKLGRSFVFVNLYFILSYVQNDVCQTCKKDMVFFRFSGSKLAILGGYDFLTFFVTKCQNLQILGVNVF